MTDMLQMLAAARLLLIELAVSLAVEDEDRWSDALDALGYLFGITEEEMDRAIDDATCTAHGKKGMH